VDYTAAKGSRSGESLSRFHQLSTLVSFLFESSSCGGFQFQTANAHLFLIFQGRIHNVQQEQEPERHLLFHHNAPPILETVSIGSASTSIISRAIESVVFKHQRR
jgi:hypothetical protein